MGPPQIEAGQGGRLQSPEGDWGSLFLSTVLVGCPYWDLGLLSVFPFS